MDHLTNCNFEALIKEIDLASGVSASKEEIRISDEWHVIPALPFLYCPCCGIKLRDLKADEN
jgi:hypothetical protein